MEEGKWKKMFQGMGVVCLKLWLEDINFHERVWKVFNKKKC
jgi:hypothetical protein